MKQSHQKNLSLVSLISLLTQSCEIEVPVTRLQQQQEKRECAAVQQIQTVDEQVTLPTTTEGSRVQSGPEFTHSCNVNTAGVQGDGTEQDAGEYRRTSDTQTPGTIHRNLGDEVKGLEYSEESYDLLQDNYRVANETCNFKESAKWAKKCLALMKKRHPEEDHPDVAYDLNRVGVSLKEIADYEEALAYQKQALEMRSRILLADENDAERQEDVAYSLSEVGGTLARLGKYERALEYKEQALKIRQKLFKDEDHPSLAHSLNSIGELLTHLGRHEEALEQKQKALSIRQRLLGNQNDPDVARSLTSVGIGLEFCDRYREALAHKEQALTMYQSLYQGKDHPNLGHALNNVGETLIRAADSAVFNPEEGIKRCQDALDMRIRLYPDQDHLQIAYSLHCIGLGLSKLGRSGEGLDKFRRALAMSLRLYPDLEQPHPYMERMMRDLERVISSKEELIVFCREVLGEEHSLIKLCTA
ncbi:MAG: tetratricopeptide repeat protein [Bacteroidota bacterium]